MRSKRWERRVSRLKRILNDYSARLLCAVLCNSPLDGFMYFVE